MTDLRTAIRDTLDRHLPDAKDYVRGVKVCTCGHEVPIGDMQARQEHLTDVLEVGLSARYAEPVAVLESRRRT